MPKRRLTDEPMIRRLRQAEAPGEQVRDVCRQYGIAEQTFYRSSKPAGASPPAPMDASTWPVGSSCLCTPLGVTCDARRCATTAPTRCRAVGCEEAPGPAVSPLWLSAHLGVVAAPRNAGQSSTGLPPVAGAWLARARSTSSEASSSAGSSAPGSHAAAREVGR